MKREKDNMSKRIYFETVKKWAIGLGISSVSIIFLIFLYLQTLGLITVTRHSGDMMCAGTIDEPCYAYINFTANEDIFLYPLGYDPYGRGTPFNFSDGLKGWKLHRSWGKGWREIDLTKGCTGRWCGCYWCTKTNPAKFSYAFRKGRSYQIRIIAYKEDAFEDVKWGFADIDPVWYGIGEYHHISIAGREYTPQCLVNCHLPINITFYKNLTLKKSDLKKVIKQQIGKFEILDWGFDYLANETYQTKEWIQNRTCYSFVEPNGTINPNCTDTGYYSTKTKWKYVWKSIPDTINIEAYKPYIIDLWVKKTANIGHSAMDVVPKIKNYELTKMAWWDSNWQYRKKLTITNNDANYKLKKWHTFNFTLDTASLISAGKMQSDCDDLRIVYQDTKELNLTIHNSTLNGTLGAFYKHAGCNQPNTMIYFMLQDNITESGSDSTNYYIYYGNPSASKYPNDLEQVFLLYDDFTRPDSDIIGNDWVEYTGDTDITSGMLDPQANNVGVRKPFDVGIIYDLDGWEWLTTFRPDQSVAGTDTWALNRSGYGTNWKGFMLRPQDEGTEKFFIQEANSTGEVVVKDGTRTYPSTFEDYRTIHWNGDFDHWFNTTQHSWSVTDDYSTTWQTFDSLVLMFNRAGDSADNVVLKRYIPTQPSFSLGSEETEAGAVDLDLFLNGTEADQTLVYGQISNITAIVNITDFYVELFMNNTLINNDTQRVENITSIAWFNASQVYNITAVSQGNSTFPSTNVTRYITVNRAPTETNLLLNGTDGNVNYEPNQVANFTVTVNKSGETVYLDSNYTGWVLQSGTTPLYNYTTLTTTGTNWNITGYYEGNQNYTSSYETHYFNVVEPVKWNDTAGYLGSNATTIDIEETVILYAMGKGDSLDYAWLSTNETGAWVNYTKAPYVSDIASMPEPIADSCGAKVGNKFYVLNGYGSGGAGDIKHSIYEYNYTTDTWTLIYNEMDNTNYGTACVGNETGIFWWQKDLARYYDIPSNTTTNLASPGATTNVTGGSCAVMYNGKIHLLTGANTEVGEPNHFVYDPATDSYDFTTYANYTRVTWGACFLWNNSHIYMMQGYNEIDNSIPWVQVYNISENKWYNATDAPTHRLGHVKGQYPMFDDKYYMIYGMTQSPTAFFSTVYEYDILRDEWRQTSSGTVPRDGIPGVLIDDKIYFAGGRDSGGAKSIAQVLNLDHGSPKDMHDSTTWTWANFTWKNSSIRTYGTVIGWKICFNDTSGNINCTTEQTFKIQEPVTSTTIKLYLNGTEANQTLIYGDISNITATIDVAGLYVELYKDGVLINNDTDRVENITDISWFANATYNITAFYPGSATYSSSNKTFFILVNKAAPTIHLALNGTEDNKTYVYGEIINATGWVENGDTNNPTILYRDNISRAGMRNYNDTTNLAFWKYSQTGIRDASAQRSCIAINNTDTYGWAVGTDGSGAQNSWCAKGVPSPFTGTDTSSQIVDKRLNFTVNNASEIEKIIFEYYGRGSVTTFNMLIDVFNFTGGSWVNKLIRAPQTGELLSSFSITDSPGDFVKDNQLRIRITTSDGSNSIAYGIATNYVTLYVVSDTLAEEIKLGSGFYNYTFFYNASQNYTASSVTYWANITKAPTLINLYLNGTENNVTGNAGEDAFNITGVLNYSLGTIYLDLNATGYGTNYASGTGSVTNITGTLTKGTYNVTAHFDGDANATASYKTFWITIKNISINVSLPPETSEYQVNYSSCLELSPPSGCYQNGTFNIINQTLTTPIFNVTNIGEDTGNVRIYLNQTISDCHMIWATNDSTYLYDMNLSNALNLTNATPQTIYYNLAPGESFGIWMWEEYRNCVAGTVFAEEIEIDIA